MNRNAMIDMLMPAIAQSGEALAPARRRLWRMTTAALHRELLLRGLLEYDDPSPLDDEDYAEDRSIHYSLLGGPGLPLYSD